MKLERPVLPKPARYVLPTESAEHFESERLAFESAIKPRDKIEQMHVEDISYYNLKTSQRRHSLACDPYRTPLAANSTAP